MSKKISKQKIFTYAVLFDIVKSAISQSAGEPTVKNEVSIFNGIVNTIKKHKESQNA